MLSLRYGTDSVDLLRSAGVYVFSFIKRGTQPFLLSGFLMIALEATDIKAVERWSLLGASRLWASMEGRSKRMNRTLQPNAVEEYEAPLFLLCQYIFAHC